VAATAGLGTVWAMTRLKVPISWIRKLSHLGSMAVIIVGSLLLGHKVFVIVGIVVAAVLLLIKLFHPPKALSTKEAQESYGEVYFFVGVALTAFIAPTISYFIIPIAILGLADTAAYIIGRSITSPKLIFSKTLAGTLAFVVVAFLLLLLVSSWPIALTGGLITALAELVGLHGSDNVTIPVVAVLILTLS